MAVEAEEDVRRVLAGLGGAGVRVSWSRLGHGGDGLPTLGA